MLPARVRALGGCFLAGSLAAHAQQPALRTYSIQDGLKYSQVFCVLQDKRGFIWAGTSYGVSRYDGRTFVTLTKGQGLPHDSVFALAEDSAGTIWVLTQEGLARVAPTAGAFGAPQLLPVPEAVTKLDGPGLRRLAAYGQTLWLSGEQGLYRFHGGKLEAVPLPPQIQPAQISQLGPAGEADVFLITPEVVARAVVGQPASILATPSDLGAPIGLTRLGDTIYLLQKEGISRLVGGGFVPAPEWRLPSGLNPSEVIATSASLAVLTPARGVVLLGRDGSAQQLSTAEGLPSPTVYDAFEDRDGLLWLGTENGLVKVFDLAVSAYPSRPPEIGSTVLAVADDARDADGATWIGHSDGLTQLREGRLTRHDPFPGSPEESGVWGVLPLPSGEVLAATAHGVVRIGRGLPARLTSLPLAGGGRAFGLHRASDGWIWATTLEGVVRFRWDERAGRPIDAEVFKEVDGRALGEARGLDSDLGGVWIGTDGTGVVRWDGHALRRFGGESGLPTGVCRTVLAADGGAFVGTDVGLYLLKDGRATGVAAVNDAFGRPYVVALARGESGSLWIALTDRIVELASGRVARTLARRSGLAGTSTTGENCLHVDRSGRLWVGMVGGVTAVDLRRRRSDWPPPQVLLLGAVDGDGRPLAPGSRVRHAANTLRFAFSSLTFLAEETTLFQERLAGYEEAWSAPHAEPSQRYTNLPRGNYTLEVRAVSSQGVSPRIATLAFSVAAPWWHTPPAWAAYALLLGGLGYAAVHWRTRQLRRHAEELSLRVAERTRDLSLANQKLEEAQERIGALLETRGQAQEDVAGWARAAAQEIARAVGAEEISVQELEGEHATSLAGSPAPAVSQAERQRLANGLVCAAPAASLVPVRGGAGELIGILAVRKASGLLGEAEQRLVIGFAHQLGGALEMRRIRQKLAHAEAARGAIRKEMEARGIVLAALCPTCGRCYAEGTALCEDDGVALEAPGLLPLRIRDRYRLVRRLGEGGMGIVYLAADEQLGRDVAIKVIRPERFDDPSMRVRFEREARAMAQIQHRGVIALFDSGNLEDGSAYLIMELLRGEDLAAHLRFWDRTTPAETASVLRQAAEALGAAHKAGVIHRDVKPENIFLSSGDGGLAVKVVDFGLARRMATGEALTRTGIVVGTPWYMAPEQVRGEPATPKSDLYSLAAVGWEMLTGRRLVAAENVGEVFAEILYSAPPPPSRFRPGLPREVDAVFARALEKDPAARSDGPEAWVSTLAPILERVGSSGGSSGGPSA